MLDKDLVDVMDDGADGRVLVMSSDVPKLRAYSRDRRFAYAASTITMPELMTGLLPDREYRRGDAAPDVMPTAWDGITFDACFGLGGSDMPFMHDAILVIGSGTSVIVPADTGSTPVAKEYARTVMTTPVPMRAREMDYVAGGKRGQRVTHDDSSTPFIAASIDVPRDKSGVMLHGDYYDDGVLSHAWMVPSISFELVVGNPPAHACGIATNHTLGAPQGERWEYMMHCNIGRGKPRAKYIDMPTNTLLRTTCSAFKDNLMRLIDLIDYASGTQRC